MSILVQIRRIYSDQIGKFVKFLIISKNILMYESCKHESEHYESWLQNLK